MHMKYVGYSVSFPHFIRCCTFQHSLCELIKTHNPTDNCLNSYHLYTNTDVISILFFTLCSLEIT